MSENPPSCVDRQRGLPEGVRGLLESAFGAVVMVVDEASLLEGAGRLRPDVAVVGHARGGHSPRAASRLERRARGA
jgi:hypothetical protein